MAKNVNNNNSSDFTLAIFNRAAPFFTARLFLSRLNLPQPYHVATSNYTYHFPTYTMLQMLEKCITLTFYVT